MKQTDKHMKTDDLVLALEKLRGVKILVFGDLMLDEFLFGTVNRISPEAPVPVLNYMEDAFVLGGAANAAANIAALGGVPRLVGCLGQDAGGERFRQELEAADISDANIVVDAGRQTTRKTRVIAHNQHVIRIDREDLSDIGHQCAGSVREKLTALLPAVDGVLISDYQKGLVLPGLIEQILRAAAERDLPVVVDSKASDISVFKGVAVLTPNVSELESMSGLRISDEASLRAAARSVLERTDAKAVLATRSEKGMSVFESGGADWTLPAHSIEVHDVTGAGDTVACVAALGLAAGLSLRRTVELANYAAAVVVRKVGTTTASPAEIERFMEGEDG